MLLTLLANLMVPILAGIPEIEEMVLAPWKLTM